MALSEQPADRALDVIRFIPRGDDRGDRRWIVVEVYSVDPWKVAQATLSRSWLPGVMLVSWRPWSFGATAH